MASRIHARLGGSPQRLVAPPASQSKSIRQALSAAASSYAVVVLPTPPFRLATARIIGTCPRFATLAGSPACRKAGERSQLHGAGSASRPAGGAGGLAAFGAPRLMGW